MISRVYPVEFSSTADDSDCFTFRYAFRPASIARDAPADFRYDSTRNQVELSFANTNPAADRHKFSGAYGAVKDTDCVLVFEKDKFRLVQVSGTVKNLRLARPAGTGGGGGGGGGSGASSSASSSSSSSSSAAAVAAAAAAAAATSTSNSGAAVSPGSSSSSPTKRRKVSADSIESDIDVEWETVATGTPEQAAGSSVDGAAADDDADDGEDDDDDDDDDDGSDDESSGGSDVDLDQLANDIAGVVTKKD
eukprot:g5574.t1